MTEVDCGPIITKKKKKKKVKRNFLFYVINVKFFNLNFNQRCIKLNERKMFFYVQKIPTETSVARKRHYSSHFRRSELHKFSTEE